MKLKNRIFMSPMGTTGEADGAYCNEGIDYFEERAKGGAGLIITGANVVSTKYEPRPCTELSDFHHVERLNMLIERCHAYGAKVCVQLSPGLGRQQFTDPFTPPYSAGSVGAFWFPDLICKPFSKEDIHYLVEKVGYSASLAVNAGADCVELHAYGGYLLDQFTIAAWNKRNDEYGGSLENRLRFPCEIVKAIKKACGEDFPVSVRYSVVSKTKDFNRGALPGEEYQEFGRDYEESEKVAKMLEEAGYDMLDCDNGSYDAWYWPHPPVYMPKACNLEDVEKVKQWVNIPVICGGRFDNPELAEKEIAAGKIDMMGMGRPLLADPDLANKFKEGREDDIRPCISCHFGCLARIFQVDMKTMSSKDISCALNPRCGMENHYNITKADVIKKVAVVGGGIAGMEAARVAALRGHSVDLYEKTDRLGGVFNEASAFDFKDDDRRLLAWYKKQIKDAGVNVKFNTEFKVEDKANYDVVFVATGASEKRLDNIPGFDQPNVRYAVDVLDKQDIKDQNVVIIGGGLTGCELAYDLARKNKKVSVVEALPTIMNVEGLAAPNYNMLVELMEYYHVDLYKNATVKEYKDGKLMIDVMTTNEPNINNRARMMSLYWIWEPAPVMNWNC